MKQEGNVVVLSKNEQFYSAYDNERYWLLEGGAQVFVVEWFDAEMTIDRQAGRGWGSKHWEACAYRSPYRRQGLWRVRS